MESVIVAFKVRAFFKKSDFSEHYHFYAFRAKERNSEKAQMFRAFDGLNFTANEAFNLLNGRAVNKVVHANGEPSHNAWFQLSKDKDEQGNFRFVEFPVKHYEYIIATALDKYPVKEMQNNDSKINLIKNLYSGNLEQVTPATNGKEEKLFVSASPKDRDLNFYDHKLMPRNRNDLCKDGFRVKADEEPKKSFRRGMGI